MEYLQSPDPPIPPDYHPFSVKIKNKVLICWSISDGAIEIIND